MIDLFVLGAGFSSLSGAPSEADMLSAILSGPDGYQLTCDLEKTLFPDNPNWIKEASINEVLSRLDMIRYFKPYNALNYNAIRELEEKLLSAMVRALQPNRTNQAMDLYSSFLTENTEASFISFNYDLVMEKALGLANLNFYRGIQTVGNVPASIQGAINLLKLHGSVDLKYCRDCQAIFQIDDKYSNADFCPHCRKTDHPLRHFLVAPTLFKSYELPAIRHLWFQALQLLIKSRSICFIGYSLPDGDILTYQLLDTAFRLARKKPRVILVNGPNFDPAKFRHIYNKNLTNTKLYFQDWLIHNQV